MVAVLLVVRDDTRELHLHLRDLLAELRRAPATEHGPLGKDIAETRAMLAGTPR